MLCLVEIIVLFLDADQRFPINHAPRHGLEQIICYKNSKLTSLHEALDGSTGLLRTARITRSVIREVGNEVVVYYS